MTVTSSRDARPDRAGDFGAGGERAASRRVYAYGVNRSRTEQMIRAMHLPIVMTEDPTDADVVLTLKNYYRRKPQPLRDAEANGTPIYVLRGNSGGQIEEGLAGSPRWIGPTTSATTSALQETEDAISSVLEESKPIELSPQSSYIRRLQHQLAERYNLGLAQPGPRAVPAGADLPARIVVGRHTPAPSPLR